MDDSLEATLAHYGVPGMRWGKRKDRKSGGSVVRDRKGKKIVVDDDGNFKNARGQKRDLDAVIARQVQQRAKKEGTDSLSNKELQALTQRMNLEQQYDRLSAGTKSEGRKIAEQIAKQEGQKLAAQAAPKIAEKLVAVMTARAASAGNSRTPTMADPWAKSVRDQNKPWG